MRWHSYQPLVLRARLNRDGRTRPEPARRGEGALFPDSITITSMSMRKGASTKD
jgi:hypothetical protein